jgi:hypothetical protein
MGTAWKRAKWPRRTKRWPHPTPHKERKPIRRVAPIPAVSLLLPFFLTFERTERLLCPVKVPTRYLGLLVPSLWAHQLVCDLLLIVCDAVVKAATPMEKAILSVLSRAVKSKKLDSVGDVPAPGILLSLVPPRVSRAPCGVGCRVVSEPDAACCPSRLQQGGKGKARLKG